MLKRFYEIDDFFESVKYKDFSRWYNEDSGAEDVKDLRKGFNLVNKTIQSVNKEKETQYLYLKKILELVETGIIAYNLESEDVLWSNDAFNKHLAIPSIKSLRFVKNRKPLLYSAIFQKKYTAQNNISIDVDNKKTMLLISSSIFNIDSKQYKLIVIQNIDDTLNRNESEAWKKLLSVMTHEIMNSIAPISSLAETLQSKVKLSIQNPKDHTINMKDLDVGIESIKKRSKGLLKFAKTYRSLNKITKLNLSKINIEAIFSNIENLMSPSLKIKGVDLIFKNENNSLEIEIDSYLIEQVLINLILNAIEACANIEAPKISIIAQQSIDGQPIIKVTDNGKGIPKAIIENIFVPFFTTKKAGSGIGLSLSKQIMLLHNGVIKVESIVDKGTLVSLIFKY